MLGLVLGTIAGAGTRAVLWGAALALWLLTRPGGWAVVAAGVLLALGWKG